MPSQVQENRLVEELQRRLADMEARIARIEQYLGIGESVTAGDENRRPSPAESGVSLERHLGSVAMTWIGGLTLVLAIILLISFAQRQGLAYVSSLIGYAVAAGIFATRNRWQEGLPILAPVFETAASLTLFYATLRLAFFSATPLVTSRAAGFFLLLVAVVGQLYFAVRRRREYWATLCLLEMLVATSVLNLALLHFAAAAFVLGASVYGLIRLQWKGQFVTALFAVFLAHLLWMMNNPIAGNPVAVAEGLAWNHVFLFIDAALLSLPLFWRLRAELGDVFLSAVTLLTGAGFALLMALNVLNYFGDRWPALALASSIFFVVVAVIQQAVTGHRLVPSLNACLGFLALSAAITGLAGMPDTFAWLALQSLVVLAFALWLRSRILAVVNTVIYFIILLAYFATGQHADFVNFSVYAAALITAIVVQKKQERLGLRTDILEILYLAATFVLLPAALYLALPAELVTISWVAAVAGYFALSIPLNNVKFRWMSIYTLLIALLYLLLVDLRRLEGIYLILAFLSLGLVAIFLSLFYTKFNKWLLKSDTNR